MIAPELQLDDVRCRLVLVDLARDQVVPVAAIGWSRATIACALRDACRRIGVRSRDVRASPEVVKIARSGDVTCMAGHCPDCGERAVGLLAVSGAHELVPVWDAFPTDQLFDPDRHRRHDCPRVNSIAESAPGLEAVP